MNEFVKDFSAGKIALEDVKLRLSSLRELDNPQECSREFLETLLVNVVGSGFATVFSRQEYKNLILHWFKESSLDPYSSLLLLWNALARLSRKGRQHAKALLLYLVRAKVDPTGVFAGIERVDRQSTKILLNIQERFLEAYPEALDRVQEAPIVSDVYWVRLFESYVSTPMETDPNGLFLSTVLRTSQHLECLLDVLRAMGPERAVQLLSRVDSVHWPRLLIPFTHRRLSVHSDSSSFMEDLSWYRSVVSSLDFGQSVHSYDLCLFGWFVKVDPGEAHSRGQRDRLRGYVSDVASAYFKPLGLDVFMFKYALGKWSAKRYLENATIGESLRLGYLLESLANFVEKKEFREDDNLVSMFMKSVQRILDLSNGVKRREALKVSKSVMRRFFDDLDLDIWDDSESSKEDDSESSDGIPEPPEDEAPVPATPRKVRPEKKKGLDDFFFDEEDESEDSDEISITSDEYESIETLSSGESVDESQEQGAFFSTKVPKPRFILDIIRYLNSKEQDENQVEKIELALTHAAEVVNNERVTTRAHLESYYADYIDALLGLGSKYGIESFDKLQESAILSILLRLPDKVAPYLISDCLYRRVNPLGVTVKIKILKILQMAAESLSKSISGDTEQKDAKEDELRDYSGLELVSSRKWGRAQGKGTSSGGVNRFAVHYAGAFIYPLLKGSTDPSSYLDIFGADSALLAELLNTLRVFVANAGPSNKFIVKVGKYLLQLVGHVRGFESEVVSSSNLFLLHTLLENLPRDPAYVEYLSELMPWLVRIAKYEKSDMVRNIGLKVLFRVERMFPEITET